MEEAMADMQLSRKLKRWKSYGYVCNIGSAGKVLGTFVAPEMLEKSWVHLWHQKCWKSPGYICGTRNAGKVRGTFVAPEVLEKSWVHV